MESVPGSMNDAAVSTATCAELRRAADRGRPLRRLAEDYRLPYAVVKRHVWGECEHTVAVPAMPME